MDEATITAVAADLAERFGRSGAPHRLVGHCEGFGLDDACASGERICALGRQRGEVPVGRKIGTPRIRPSGRATS